MFRFDTWKLRSICLRYIHIAVVCWMLHYFRRNYRNSQRHLCTITFFCEQWPENQIQRI